MYLREVEIYNKKGIFIRQKEFLHTI
jgi:hypothetical protein